MNLEANIKVINGKFTVNGKSFEELSILEHGMLNAYFKEYNDNMHESFISTADRCKKFCLDKAKDLIVNDPIVLPTNAFDEAFNNPIEQIDNFLTK